MPTIRPATPDDAAAWAEVVAESSPYLVQDAGSVAHEMRTEPPDAIRLVAEEHGVVIGIARLRARPGERQANLHLQTRPDHRRAGVGRALLDACEPLIRESGRDQVRTVVEDDEGSRIAAGRWGFELTRPLRTSAVDPRTVPPPAPDDRIRSLDGVAPREVWELFNAVVADDPSGLSQPLSWEEWLGEWEDPRTRPDLSFGARVAGELVAFTVLGRAGERAWSDMTGTLLSHRGQGLALLCKQHSLHAAAAAGVTRCFAGNDRANTAMVAVNDRLGYRPFAAPRVGVRRR